MGGKGRERVRGVYKMSVVKEMGGRRRKSNAVPSLGGEPLE